MTSRPNGQATLSSVRSSVAMIPEKSASWNALRNEPRPLSGDLAVWQALRKTSPPDVASPSSPLSRRKLPRSASDTLSSPRARCVGSAWPSQ